VAAVVAEARPGDTVLTLGAGDVWKLGDDVLRGLARREVPAGGRR
jgi:UDP-N-acetylmuramate-alanine ligase